MYGQDGAPDQTVISEDGTMDAFWVMKINPSSVATLHKPIYGMAYRTGNGKVVFGHTSLGIAGPGKWTFVSCSKKDTEPTPTIDTTLDFFESRVVSLAIGQRSPEWFLFSQMVAERGRPLPHGRYILSTLAAFWNRIKGGIDVFSRHLKNAKANHKSLSPYAACWICLIMAMVYNSPHAPDPATLRLPNGQEKVPILQGFCSSKGQIRVLSIVV
jgi:hypothetical protein